MNGKLTYVASLVLGGLSLVILVVNMSLISANRHKQDEINQRAGDLNKASTIANLNQSLTQALAQVAIDNNDKAVKDLLAAQGITITTKAAAEAAAAANAQAKKK